MGTCSANERGRGTCTMPQPAALTGGPMGGSIIRTAESGKGRPWAGARSQRYSWRALTHFNKNSTCTSQRAELFGLSPTDRAELWWQAEEAGSWFGLALLTFPTVTSQPHQFSGEHTCVQCTRGLGQRLQVPLPLTAGPHPALALQEEPASQSQPKTPHSSGAAQSAESSLLWLLGARGCRVDRR